MRWLVPSSNARFRPNPLQALPIYGRVPGTAGGGGAGWIIDGDTVVQVASTRRFTITIDGDTVTSVGLAA